MGVEKIKLSVIIPAYNEVDTIDEIVSRVEGSPIKKEIIIVDDCSTDGTRDRIREITKKKNIKKNIDKDIRAIYHDRNRGKGAALRTGFASATGDIVIIQDADLELNPEEYPSLVAPIIDGRADVVYGSRFLEGGRNGLPLVKYMANVFLTRLSNILNKIKLTDMETCYKVFRREVLDKVTISSDRFGFEPEFTAKVARAGFEIYEVPVTYRARSSFEGKKICWRDGVKAVFLIFWFRFFD